MEMTFKVRELFGDIPADLLSGSCAELGPDAGAITWRWALQCAEHSEDLFRDAGCDYAELADHFRAYGAWEDAEVDGWSERELRAMAIQEMAADYRTQAEDDGEVSRHAYDADTHTIHSYWGI